MSLKRRLACGFAAAAITVAVGQGAAGASVEYRNQQTVTFPTAQGPSASCTLDTNSFYRPDNSDYLELRADTTDTDVCRADITIILSYRDPDWTEHELHFVGRDAHSLSATSQVFYADNRQVTDIHINYTACFPASTTNPTTCARIHTK